jgi:small-conductance mechanosensitive channel
MTRDRIAGIGFHHPDRNARPLTKRKLALAHLLMTAVLVICIVIAVTAVAIGSARAETLSALAHGREGILPLAILIGLLLAGIGGIFTALVRHP